MTANISGRAHIGAGYFHYIAISFQKGISIGAGIKADFIIAGTNKSCIVFR